VNFDRKVTNSQSIAADINSYGRTRRVCGELATKIRLRVPYISRVTTNYSSIDTELQHSRVRPHWAVT